jgi:lycopene cyclase domain-containing protein
MSGRLLTKKRAFWALVLVVSGLLWATNAVQQGQLMERVGPLFRIDFLETHWLYAGLLAFTFSFPLLFGFLPQLKFYQKWPRFLAANLPVSAVFIVWDVYFTKIGVWGFSEKYTTGWRPLGLPWEECLFFVCIPAACVFIDVSLRHFFPKEPFARFEKGITLCLMLLFFSVGLLFWSHIYTATATLGCGLFLLYQLLFVKNGRRGWLYLTFLVSCIPFLIVNGILTGIATESPVVLYNPEEYFGLRMGTIPVDDLAYSFLMLGLNIELFHRSKSETPGTLA